MIIPSGAAAHSIRRLLLVASVFAVMAFGVGPQGPPLRSADTTSGTPADRARSPAVESRASLVVDAAVPRAGRRGLVRLDGRTFVDDDGPYLAVGASLFWALWGFQHDRPRLERHLEYLSSHDVDYIRVFGVIGPRWQDRVVDPRQRAWDQHLAGLLDLAHGTYGLRVELTIWQDTELTPTPAERMAVADRVAAVVAPRPQTVQYLEIANEGYATGWTDKKGEARQLASHLRSKTPHVVAVTSPATLERREIDSWYAGSSANLLTPHLPREAAGHGITAEWQYVRQTWDPWLATDLPWTNDEGKGPQSSVAADDDPLRLVMYAGMTWLCGGAGFVLHTGAGVGGGDAASKARGRVSNLWEVSNIERTLAGIAAMRRLLPADLPNWRRHNSNKRFSGYPWDIGPIGRLIETNQLVRAYAATSPDGRIVAMPIGAAAPVPFTPRFPMHIDVHDPMTGTLREAHDGAFTLAPAGAAVLIGRRR